MSIVRQITEPVSRLIKLYIEEARLGTVERVTRLLSAIAIAFFGTLLLIVGLTFISLGVAVILSKTIEPWVVYCIIGAFYIFVVSVVYAFRHSLIINPICRRLSKLLLKSSDYETSNN